MSFVFWLRGWDLKGPLASRVVFGTKHSLAPKASRFGSTASRKATLWLSYGANPLPPVALRREVLLKFKSQLCNQKTKDTRRCPLFFVLYRLNRCHTEKVKKIKGFRLSEAVSCASKIDDNRFMSALVRLLMAFRDTHPLNCPNTNRQPRKYRPATAGIYLRSSNRVLVWLHADPL